MSWSGVTFRRPRSSRDGGWVTHLTAHSLVVLRHRDQTQARRPPCRPVASSRAIAQSAGQKPKQVARRSRCDSLASGPTVYWRQRLNLASEPSTPSASAVALSGRSAGRSHSFLGTSLGARSASHRILQHKRGSLEASTRHPASAWQSQSAPFYPPERACERASRGRLCPKDRIGYSDGEERRGARQEKLRPYRERLMGSTSVGIRRPMGFGRMRAGRLPAGRRVSFGITGVTALRCARRMVPASDGRGNFHRRSDKAGFPVDRDVQ